jgi:transcriptional regulator with XRE-family HTH domain
MGFSQQDVMRFLKLDSTSMISRWERGVSMPSGINLLKLSLLYKTLVNELYYGYGKELQAELFPEERGIIFRRTKRSRNRSVRGP